MIALFSIGIRFGKHPIAGWLLASLVCSSCALPTNTPLLNQKGDEETLRSVAPPSKISGVITNPGMGFTDWSFAWRCNVPLAGLTAAECAANVRSRWPTNYPRAGTAYFRWFWNELEPVKGQINFKMIDDAIAVANQLGETFAFRVMVPEGMPQWLIDSVPTYNHGGTRWPDSRSATFRAEHQRLLSSLGARYNGHPAIDHIDIGTVGCWGEWNTACISGVDIFNAHNPSASEEEKDEVAAAYKELIHHHVTAFSNTPLVMLGIGGEGGRSTEVMKYAMEQRAGWRVDCWGDWGYWGPGWNHQVNYYPQINAQMTQVYPDFKNVWKHAPVQLEVCGTIGEWESRLGWSANAPDGPVYKTFKYALDQHAAVLNVKSTAVPAAYVPAMNEMLEKQGYRFVIDAFAHSPSVGAGGELQIESTWNNLGTIPYYHRRALSYRLTGKGGTVVLSSETDIRTWLPGPSDVSDRFTVPATLPAGEYDLDVALVDRAGTNPTTTPLPPLQLGIGGRLNDGWYRLSRITVR